MLFRSTFVEVQSVCTTQHFAPEFQLIYLIYYSWFLSVFILTFLLYCYIYSVYNFSLVSCEILKSDAELQPTFDTSDNGLTYQLFKKYIKNHII